MFTGEDRPSLPPVQGPLPLAYRWLVAHGLIHFKPWHIAPDPDDGGASRAAFRIETGYRRDVLPFARRQDNDDTAGFEIIDGRPTSRVIAYHPAFVNRLNAHLIDAEFDDLWSFLAARVVDDMRWWADESELDAMGEVGESEG